MNELGNGSFKKLKLIVQDIELGVEVNKNIQTLLERLINGSASIDEILNLINETTIKKVGMLNIIAVKFLELGNSDYVLSALNRALELDRTNPDTLYNLGYVLYAMGQFSLSIQYLNQIPDKDSEIQMLLEEMAYKTNTIVY